MTQPRINNNAHLREVHRNLMVHTADANRQIEQVASGRRVNRSSDDPASLALADGIRSEIRAMAEGTRNVQQSIHMLQVTDGALSSMADMLRRMHTLSVESASTTYNDADRVGINKEFQVLKEEIDRIAQFTSFNGISILEEDVTFSIQAGPSETSNDVSTIRIGNMRPGGPNLDVGHLAVGTQNDGQTAINQVQKALDAVISERNNIAAFQSRLEQSVSTTDSILERMTNSESAIRDVDIAKAMSSFTRSQILAQTAASFAVEADVDIERVLSLLQ
jgi:flagellin